MNDLSLNKLSINVFQLQKNQYNKEQGRIKIYNKILNKCYYKIESSSNNEKSYCFFIIPEYIPGIPIYNLTKCVIYLIKNLRENGFICKYCHPLNLYVSWYSQDSCPLLSGPNQKTTNITYKKKKVYKDINDYKPNGFFLYKDLIK